jgi:carboxymethylenebutenolidase
MPVHDLHLQLDALLPGNAGVAGPTRRNALKTALGLGYASAALPALAQDAIRTSTQGLRTGEIFYEVNGFKVPAYFAAPAGRSNLPVLLVVHEVFGVHEYIADVARRLAHAGYLAIAPELFARQGDPASYGEVGRLIAEVVNKAPDAQVLADLDGALHWAGANGADASRAAITGFCWGGRIVWMYAAHNPALKAGVAWYGRLAGAVNDVTPAHPLDIAARLQAPVLGLYGGDDAGISLDSVQRMKAALSAGGAAARASEFTVYPDAPHAFHADYRPTYRQRAAQDGWQRCLAWLRKHGAAP